MAKVTVKQWVAKVKRRMDAIVIESTQDLVDEVSKVRANGGNMRLKTGFLRASLRASTSAMPRINSEFRPPSDAADNSFKPSTDEISLAVANFKAGGNIYLGFTASYAAHREYHDKFVAAAAQKWKQIVAVNVRKANKAGF